jgi:hypothetical protein
MPQAPPLPFLRMARRLRPALGMTAGEFVELSTRLVNDINVWVAEASRDAGLSPGDLALLEATVSVIAKVTIKEAEVKPDRAS